MKLLYSYYIPETGESTVTLANRYGTYTGTARVHPEDKNNASEYAGGRLAESRAWVKSLQDRRRRLRIKLDATMSLYKDLLNNVDTPIEVQYRFDVFIKKYRKDIKEIDEMIKTIKATNEDYFKVRDEILRRAKENKENQ